MQQTFLNPEKWFIRKICEVKIGGVGPTWASYPTVRWSSAVAPAVRPACLSVAVSSIGSYDITYWMRSAWQCTFEDFLQVRWCSCEPNAQWLTECLILNWMLQFTVWHIHDRFSMFSVTFSSSCDTSLSRQFWPYDFWFATGLTFFPPLCRGKHCFTGRCTNCTSRGDPGHRFGEMQWLSQQWAIPSLG